MATGFNHTDNGSATEQELGVESEVPLCATNTAELISVGQVEISDEATLEDLKTQVEFQVVHYFFIFYLFLHFLFF